MLGRNHPDTLASLGNLGVCVHAQGRLAEAEELQRETLTGRRQALGADHPMTLRAQYDLGGCLLDQRRWSEGEPLLVEVVDRLIAGAPVAGIQREIAIRRLVGFYTSWETAEPGQGRGEKALAYRAQLSSDG